jgi:hypothetical protein
MSSHGDVRPAEVTAGGEAETPEGGSGPWARARRGLRVPGALMRLVVRDPQHIPERLAIYAVDRRAAGAREWAQRVQDAEPGESRSELVEIQRRRTVSASRIDGAIAGTPFFIALVPAYIAFLQQEIRFHLRVAALYGHDLTDPRVAADFLVLRGVHQIREQALAELDVVRATPVPPKRSRAPFRSWYAAVVRILILAGFLSAPDEDERGPLTPLGEGRARDQVHRRRADLGTDVGCADYVHDPDGLGVRERCPPLRSPGRHPLRRQGRGRRDRDRERRPSCRR